MGSNRYHCDLCDRGFESLRALLLHKRSASHQRARGNQSLKNLMMKVIGKKDGN